MQYLVEHAIIGLKTLDWHKVATKHENGDQTAYVPCTCGKADHERESLPTDGRSVSAFVRHLWKSSEYPRRDSRERESAIDGIRTWVFGF